MTTSLPVIQPTTSPGVHRTEIEWCDYAVGGPVRFRESSTGRVMNACVKHSPGCRSCYSEAIGLRFKRGLPFTKAAMEGLTPFLDEGSVRHMLTFKPRGPFKGGARPRVFMGDMTDLFGEWVKPEWLDCIFAVCALRPDVDWLFLTKRAERMAEYMTEPRRPEHDAFDPPIKSDAEWRNYMRLRQWPDWPLAWDGDHGDLCSRAIHRDGWWAWPLPNVWLGVSCEDQQRADERIPHLLRTPAAVRFLSCEPLLGALDLLRVDAAGFGGPAGHKIDPIRKGFWSKAMGFVNHSDMHDDYGALHWVIVGGESGHEARAMDVGWARAIVKQCAAAAVPVFVKQLGAHVLCRNDHVSDWLEGCNLSVEYVEGAPAFQGDPIRVRLRDRKGGDISEWPPELQVREWPRGGAA